MQLQNQWKPNNFNMASRLFLPTLYLVMYLTQMAKLVFGFLGEEGPQGCCGLLAILAGFLKDCSSHLAIGDLAKRGRSNHSIPEESCPLGTGAVKSKKWS
jgi:hypothetical protein